MATKHEDQRAIMAANTWAVVIQDGGRGGCHLPRRLLRNKYNSVRLFPWCISSVTNLGALPTCYLSEALATTMQWRAKIPMASTSPESRDLQAQVSMSRLACQTETLPLPILPLSNIPHISTPPVGHSLTGLLIDPSTWSGIASPVVPPMIDLARRLVSKPLKATSAVGAAHCRAMENCLKYYQRCMTMVCVPPGVLKSTTVRTTLTTMVISQPKMNCGRMQLTLIWNWPQGIVSLAQIQKSWSSEWHERDSRRWYRPPVALWGAALGLRPK